MILPSLSVKSLLESEAPLEDVCVEGWIGTARKGKDVLFLEIGDGSSTDSLQVVLSPEVDGYESLSRLSTGASVRMYGTLIESQARGQRVELQAVRGELTGAVDDDYPLQKKRHSLEFLRSIAHLRTRSRTFGSVFRVRHALQMSIHNFFHKKGFINVHTPIITASDCEGAGQMFSLTSPGEDGAGGTKNDASSRDEFFGRPASLTVSGQLEAEIFALAFKNVYTFGPTFRAEDSHTSRHAAEFWMVEPEMAFCDLAGCTAVAEEFVRSIVGQLVDTCADELAFFEKWYEKGLIEKLTSLLNSPFETISYTEAVGILERSGRKFEFQVKWGMDLQAEHERYLAEEHFKGPLFVTDYPRSIKSFYMRLSDDSTTVAAMDLLVPFVGEIIGGSQREERLEVLKEQMKFFGLDEKNYWWYLDLRRYGTVPHAGFGLGFDRFMMYVTGMKNIRDVIPFPRTPGSAEF